ncbi:hypothetical protein ACU5AX_18450 [Sphingomonas sp. XXL09]|uniref:hypothetical protein n=1 Tax=Sphingomonas sp. XXL09 TaxID=3457787 RepID=UPI00406BACC2
MANHDAPEDTDDIRALLAHLLAGVTGKPEAHWAKLIGEVTALPIVFDPQSNWRIDPSGTKKEIEAIAKAAEVVRQAHPYVPSPKTLT